MTNYGTETGFDTYVDDRGYRALSGDVAQALVRASFYIDGLYGARFSGVKTGGRAQVMAWPRSGAVDRDGAALGDDEVPVEVEYATYEAALRELASSGSLSPDITPGKIKKRVKVEGAVDVEYAIGQGTAAEQRPVIAVIDGLLAGLLAPTAHSSPWIMVV